MTQDPKKIALLLRRLQQLQENQEGLQSDIRDLQREINALTGDNPQPAAKVTSKPPTPSLAEQAPLTNRPQPTNLQKRLGLPARSGLDWEKFIGENLISRIGILITVIGVAFGVKYAIDRELITPLMRIFLGYLAGIGLSVLAIRLRPRYEAFSAVLQSGALAIAYIITYFAYSYYTLMPQGLAFALMAIITGLAVFTALSYDRQIIALMGLVGAYAVPYLISEDSGKAEIFLGYITLINTGILIIAFRKYWKILFNTALWVSWLIFGWWLAFGYQSPDDFGTGMFFAFLFLGLFGTTTLAYEVAHGTAFRRGDRLLLIANAFLYFGAGYWLLGEGSDNDAWQGAFAFFTAALHFGPAAILHWRFPQADRSLAPFLAGLGIVFLILAVPIQLDGRWVTLLWVAEAALLFWLSRRQKLAEYEKLVFALLVLAFGSLLHDWSVTYGGSFSGDAAEWPRPLRNVQLLSSLIFAGILGGMSWMQQQARYASTLPESNWWRQGLTYFIPGLFLFSLYYAFRGEIEYYWRLEGHLQLNVREAVPKTASLLFNHLSLVWVTCYSLLFLILLSWANILRIRNLQLGWVNMALNVFGVLAFLVAGLFSLSEIRDIVLRETAAGHGLESYPYLRYLGYLLVAGLLYTTYRYQRSGFLQLRRRWPFDALLHLSVFWIASSEVIHWFTLSDAGEAYKLGLSILWGVYSLGLIALGIAQRKAYLRVSAIVLFAITLIKLFFYDIADLDTVSKTIVMVSLGILLLSSSFLYNKFKDRILPDKSDA